MTLAQTIQEASVIFSGRLSNAESRWGDKSRTWMHTDYTFEVTEAVLGEGIKPGSKITITLWGGTIGKETQEIAGMPKLIVGNQYVLMLNKDWRTAAPLVGGYHGLFHVVKDARTGTVEVRGAEGAPLVRTDSNRIVRRLAPGARAVAGPVTLADFLKFVRAEAPRVKKLAPRQRPKPNFNDPRVLKPYTRPADPKRQPPEKGARLSKPAVPKLQSGPVQKGKVVKMPSTGLEKLVRRPPWAERQKQLVPFFTTDGSADLPIVINQFPSTSPWSPEDQYQMSKWNHYASGVFQVYQTPTTTWSYGNGVFDLAGWVDSATMKQQFGKTWEELGFIAVTFTRKNGNKIIEADVAFNPAYTWTLDDEWVYNGGSAQGFRQTMTHELGHVWGLQHNFNFMSIMNYPPGVYRDFSFPYMDDAQAIRALYASHKVETTDLGIYLYYSAGFQSWQDASFPSSVKIGSSFTVTNYHLENVGTKPVDAPAVEWYLTTARNFTATYYYLATTTYPKLDTYTYFTPSTVSRTLTVPSSVPAGTYYLGAFIRGDESAGQTVFPFDNSRCFSRLKITITH
jgi:hypothetical protein